MTHDEVIETIDGMHRTDWMKGFNALYAVSKLTQTYKDDSYVNEEFNQGLQTGFRLVMDVIERELRR